ncbi:hypothetical protein [Deinococcus arcticus]|uniref:Uncharacterized protein n=1 Tax=Deinococcus arcticus TaxID=2136176 RepID=A0A2T3W3L7_9DEIO|nr:hypothetical protein [Deinococcus arcticus]PTA66501.1 hypothetical protein C8263_17660 [Deinococcus arcticus]
MTGPRKGSRGRGPKKNTAQGRGGVTRDSSRPVRERAASTEAARPQAKRGPERPGGEGSPRAGGKSGGSKSGGSQSGGRSGPFRGGFTRAGARPGTKKPLPELKRVQLSAPAPDTVFVDRDGEGQTFPDSNLKRVAAQILSAKRKAWRYRPFSFPLFTDRGHEQSFHFDFYVYDAEDSVIRLILVVPFESREVWDRVGRFKRQYPMYPYELWTPEKLFYLSGPRGRLEF